MSAGASDEKKKEHAKNKQPKRQTTPTARQAHVVLWDEPPMDDPQEDDTDHEPDRV